MRSAFCTAPLLLRLFIKAFKWCILIRGDPLISLLCTSLLICLIIMRGIIPLWLDVNNPSKNKQNQNATTSSDAKSLQELILLFVIFKRMHGVIFSVQHKEYLTFNSNKRAKPWAWFPWHVALTKIHLLKRCGKPTCTTTFYAEQELQLNVRRHLMKCWLWERSSVQKHNEVINANLYKV